jgi:hypothetical protein
MTFRIDAAARNAEFAYCERGFVEARSTFRREKCAGLSQ